MKMKLSEMTREERSLLLYLESCLVESRGRVNLQRTNNGDMTIIDKWNNEKFIKKGRIVIDKYMETSGSMWVEFSNSAWELAHEERKNRSTRMTKKRQWVKTSEQKRQR